MNVFGEEWLVMRGRQGGKLAEVRAWRGREPLSPELLAAERAAGERGQWPSVHVDTSAHVFPRNPFQDLLDSFTLPRNPVHDAISLRLVEQMDAVIRRAICDAGHTGSGGLDNPRR